MAAPAAVQAEDDVHETEPSAPPPLAGLGVGTIRQRLPFQRSASVPEFDLPVAMQNEAEGQEIAPKGTPPAGGLGVGMMRQRLPFHRSMRALFELEPPAAKHTEDVGHDTPLKLPPPTG
jgi:hypothetical protein